MPLIEQIARGVGILRRGGVIAIPTDTLYGLAACALDSAAVERVFALKGRPPGEALPLLLADAEDMDRYAVDVPSLAWPLTERFWPGALTLVLSRAAVIPDIVTGGLESVALRVPDHEVPRTLARELDAPITGTSANRSRRKALATAAAVRVEFGDRLDAVIDAGEAPAGVASTVLDLSGERPRILRSGAVARCAIEEVCGFEVSTTPERRGPESPEHRASE